MTDDCRQALDLAARLEGLVLDPVYSGKALAGLIAARADGRIAPDQKVVFLHTGGMPALFAAAYAEWIRQATQGPSSFQRLLWALTMRVRGTHLNASRQCMLLGPPETGSGSITVSTR